MTWDELPAKLKIYILLLIGLAILIAIWAARDLLINPHDNGWLVLAILVIISIPLYLYLPSVETLIGIGDAYIMAIAMMYGVAPCIVATLCQTLPISVFAKRRPIYLYRIAFNIASTTCCAWLYSSIYYAIVGNQGSVQLREVIVGAAILVATYFFANSILTSIAISWSQGESVLRFWAKACVPLAFDYSMSAAIAIVIVGSHTLHPLIPFAAALFIGIVWAWNRLHRSRIAEADQLYLRTVESLALAVDAKDQTTYGHIRRVRVYATGLAKLCGNRNRDELKAIENASLLHDIGKIAIDDYILNKPGRLSKQEFEKMKMHTAAGDEILQPVNFPFPVAKYVRSHHERWDGQGYPDGLKGEEIPLGARILAIADAFDAIRFSRPYKLSMATDEAVDILRTQAGSAYDPKLVQLFTDHIGELEQVAKRESEDAPKLSFRKYSESIDRDPSFATPNCTNLRDIPAELVRLAELCCSLSAHLDLTDILAILSRRLESLVPFSTCAFYLGRGGDQISVAYVSGKFSDILRGHTIEVGKGISGWVCAYRRPMINTGPALDFQNIQGDFTSFTDALVVPVVYGDESLGTISLYAQEPISYGQYDLNVLQILAGFLAPVILESRRQAAVEMRDVIDPITQIHRISYLTAVGPQLISFARENRSPISLIYIEIKNLSQIMRIFGGNLGNSMLRKIADCIKPELRETDILVRYGHQGFVALLPGVREEQALRCIERLRQQIRNEALAIGQGIAIDCKTAVSSYPKDGATVFDLLQSAYENIRSSHPDAAASDSNVIDFFPRA